jgi:hypothetical protein
MTFNDLEFKPHPVSKGGVQAKTMIGNYELSVVNLNSHGPLYEIAIFDGKDGPFVKLPGIHSSTDYDTDDVIHYLSPEKISGIMLKLSCIAGPVSV